MAGNVKKGFGIYFLILLLSIVATFLIICVVMIFQPNKVILGYKYFIYRETSPFEYQLTSDKSSIDFKSINVFRVNSDYADIRIEKNPRVDGIAVVVKNNSKGFAREGQDTDFSYSIETTVENGKKILDISIVEPQGVLFFQKDVEIALYVPYYDTEDGSHNISGKEFIFTTNSGNIYIGNQYAINEISPPNEITYSKINPSNLTIQSSSGLVYLYPEIQNNSLNLNIKTKSSYVKMFSNMTFSNLSLRTQNGSFDLKSLDCFGECDFVLANGSLSAGIIGGNINLSIKGGSCEISQVVGSISANNSIENATSARIEIGEVTKNVSLPFLGGSSVTIDKVGGQAYLEGEGANINIKKIADSCWVKTTSGKIKVYTTGKDLTLQSTTGNITVYFASETIGNKLSFVSTSGNINLYTLASLGYTMNVYDTNDEPRTKNVKVEPFEEYSNPLQVNGGEKIIEFRSNGKINVSYFTIPEESVA